MQKTFKQAIQIAKKIGLPLMVRPSYVLGGRAMEIVHEKSQLKNFVEEAFKAAEENPILIDKFIRSCNGSGCGCYIRWETSSCCRYYATY